MGAELDGADSRPSWLAWLASRPSVGHSPSRAATDALAAASMRAPAPAGSQWPLLFDGLLTDNFASRPLLSHLLALLSWLLCASVALTLLVLTAASRRALGASMQHASAIGGRLLTRVLGGTRERSEAASHPKPAAARSWHAREGHGTPRFWPGRHRAAGSSSWRQYHADELALGFESELDGARLESGSNEEDEEDAGSVAGSDHCLLSEAEREQMVR